jgi:hypothetical protein
MGFAAPSRTLTPHHKEEKLHKKNINQPQLIFVRKKRESREGREKKKKRRKKTLAGAGAALAGHRDPRPGSRRLWVLLR